MRQQPPNLRALGTPRTRVFAVTLIAVLAVIGWLAWQSANSLEAVAGAAMQDILAGRFERVTRIALEEERRGGSLEGDMRAVWDVVIGPALSNCEPMPGIEVRPNLEGRGAIARKRYRLPNGEYGDLSVSVWQTEGGPRACILAPLLQIGWSMRFKQQLDYSAKDGDHVRARLAGLKQDRAELERRGVRGVFSVRELKFVTWDEMEAQSRLKLLEYEPVATRSPR